MKKGVKIKKIIAFLVCLALLLIQAQAFAEVQTVSETLCAFDAGNSYNVDNNNVKQVTAFSGIRPMNVKNSSTRAGYLQFNLTSDIIEKIKQAEKLKLKVSIQISKNAHVTYKAYNVGTWGTADNYASWALGTQFEDTKYVESTQDAGLTTDLYFDVTDAISNINDNDTYVRFAVSTTSDAYPTNTYLLGGWEEDGKNNTYYQPKLIAEYATRPAAFYAKNSEKINCTERLYVNLLTNEKRSSTTLFTQDHSTNDIYDYDDVMLVRYHISDIQDVSSMSFTTKLSTNKLGTTKAKFFLADNSWTSSDTSFTSVKEGTQTELFTSLSFDNYSAVSAYRIIPFTLSAAQVEAVKAAAEDGYFTILVRAINTKADREDVTWTAEGYTTVSQNNNNAFVDILKVKKLNNLNTISAGDTITAERYVVEGTDVQTIHGIPIIAIYDGDTLLKNVALGSAVDLDGSGQTISAEIEVPDGITTPIVSLFIWESLDNIRPVLDMNSIRYNP